MTRFLPILIAAPLTFAFADSIKLKSGEVIEGKITKSDASGITIEVQFSPTIVDERHVNRADILGTAITSHDEAAYTKIRDIAAPDTAFDAHVYNQILDTQLRPFLKQFAYSTRVTDVKAKVKSFEADVARLKAGEIKVAGVWYDAESRNAEKYQIEAASILAAMKQQIAAGDFPAALNSFGLLQRTYPASVAYADSVPLAESGLQKLIQQLTFAIANLPEVQAQRQAAIDRTPIEDRPPIQRAVDVENARAAAIADAAQQNGQLFYALIPYDEKGLKSMQQAAQDLAGQLKALNKKQLAANAKLVYQLRKELQSHELAGAETTLTQLKIAWPEYEGLGRLEQQLKSGQDAVNASQENGGKGDPKKSTPSQ